MSTNMLTGPATVTQDMDNGRKRIRFTDGHDAQPTASVLKNPQGQSPSSAAKTCSINAVASLHHGLRTHFLELAEKFILAFSAWYYKNEKLQKMKNDVDFIPSSTKIGLTLEPLDEVRKSEEYKALAEDSANIIAQCQKELHSVVVQCAALNVKALKKRIQKSFVTALPAVAEGFLAKDNIKELSKHQVVGDLLDRHQDEVFGHLVLTRDDITTMYRDIHGVILPSATPVRASTAQPTPAAEAPIAPAQAPAVAAPTAPAQAHAPALAASPALAQTPAGTTTPAPAPANTMVTPASGTNPLSYSQQIRTAAELLRDSPNEEYVVNRYNGGPHGYYIPRRDETNAAIQNMNNPADIPDPEDNARITAFDYNDNNENSEDEVMEEARHTNNNNNEVCVGARATIVREVRNVMINAFAASTEAFINQVKINETNARIKKATAKQRTEQAADDITAALQNEGSVDPKILKGLIQEEARKRTTELDRRIQSLEAKLDHEKKKGTHTRDSATSKTKSAKNSPRGAQGGAASKNKSKSTSNRSSTPSSRRGREVDESGKDSTKNKQEQRKSRSSSKSRTKKSSSNTKSNRRSSSSKRK